MQSKLIDKGYGVLAVDFDGTIASYDGWKGPGVFGPPLPGAREALDRLNLKGYTIIINTTRGVDIEQVKEYLVKHHIPHHHINENRPDAPPNLGDRKVMADVYIDDRAMPFEGRWEGMVNKVEDFVPWYRRPNRRPSLNLMVAGYHVDQVSLYVPELRKSIDEYASLGHDGWVLDNVRAEVVKSGTGYEALRGTQFTVALAFNYTLYPCEFELLQVLQGQTVQVPDRSMVPGLSHYGFHVDDLAKAVNEFNLCGYPTMTWVKTLEHSGCPHLYEYVFIDTRPLGFISKLICRAQDGGND